MSYFEDQTLGRIHFQDVNDPQNDDCSFYTNQPSPGQWVAIGITASCEPATSAQQLLVGTGRTELAAIRELHHRCQQRARELTIA